MHREGTGVQFGTQLGCLFRQVTEAGSLLEDVFRLTRKLKKKRSFTMLE